MVVSCTNGLLHRLLDFASRRLSCVQAHSGCPGFSIEHQKVAMVSADTVLSKEIGILGPGKEHWPSHGDSVQRVHFCIPST